MACWAPIYKLRPQFPKIQGISSLLPLGAAALLLCLRCYAPRVSVILCSLSQVFLVFPLFFSTLFVFSSPMAVNRREKEERERGEKITISIIPQKRLKTEAEVQERLRGASSSSCSSSVILDASLGFFGLVEIASLANAEVKSLNILRNSRKNKKNPKGEEKLHLLPKPDWSCWRYVHRCMGGVHFHVFLFKRKLTKTDVNPSEARLFMNKKETKEVLQGALTRREEKLVFDQANGLEVEVIDRLGYRYNTRLKYWRTVRQFALFKEWKTLVKKNQLAEGDVIRLWFFRYGVDLKLGFLIIPGEDDD